MTTHSLPEGDRAFTRPIEPDEHEKPDQVEPESDPVMLWEEIETLRRDLAKARAGRAEAWDRAIKDFATWKDGEQFTAMGRNVKDVLKLNPYRKALAGKETSSIRWKPSVGAFHDGDDPFLTDPHEDQHD